ncbi:MAG: Mu transposase C-terminal domain-containing protein [Candidatus Pseudoruminococcus sp.]|nr:Mu transposase C-terminal domain-containing protein [Ruminococcus sp.]MDY2782332.1 Mu transposase C-terminal domain-containing protein [Candidatus Pseudoruminococcus sp.]
METYLTIKEAAELKGCSTRYLRQAALSGSIKAKKELNDKNRPQYLIPLSALDAKLQLKYQKAHGLVLPEEEVDTSSRTIEELNEQQRNQINTWLLIIENWQSFRNQYKGSKAEADKAYIALASEKYPDIKITYDILQRKYNAIRKGDKVALADGRGYTRKGASCIPSAVWDAFLYYYLDERQYPVKKCYEYTKLWTREEQPHLLEQIPSYSTFCRHIENDITEGLKTLGRYGEKAFKDRYAPYIKRLYDNMESNEWWIADNHTFDVMTTDGKTTHRLYLTAFMDARSGILTGIYVTNNPSSQATLIALRKGIMEYGIPANIYVDNGREFLTFDVGGLGHRQKKSTKDKFTPPPVFERLGIKMTNAIVRNAKAKIIERRFLDLKNSISRLFETFTGGNVLEKPESLKTILKSGRIPNDIDFTQQIEMIVKYYFNRDTYNGAVAKDKGKLKQQVYEENLLHKRIAEESELNLMLMRSSKAQTVGRRGVHLTISGQRIDYFNKELLDMQGKKVYYRYDPDNLSAIRIYDLEDRYLMTVSADNTAICEYGASQEEVSTAMHKVKEYESIVKKSLKAQKALVLGKHTALDLVLREVERNKEISITPANPILTIQRADESLPEAVGGSTRANVDIDRMIHSAERRKKQKG